MSLFYQLVFSNNLRFRITRHVLFWLTWISFYAFVKTYQWVEIYDYAFWKMLPLAWLELLIQIPIDIAFCYSVLYFLLPNLFLNGRYFSFVLLWVLLVFLAAAINHIYYFWAIPSFRVAVGLKPPESHVSLFLGALMIMGSLNSEGGFAAAIKLGKLFFIKEKETELLQQEVSRMGVGGASEDTSIQPTFLFNVLNRLYALAQKERIDPTASIKKINDLILYSAYDAKNTMLPLSRELDALEEYIELEKLSFNYNIDVRYSITGEPHNKVIIPYVLIPLVENSFAIIGQGNAGKPWLFVDITIDNSELKVQVKSNKSSDSSTLLGQKNLNVLNIENRLRLRYPGAYQLKKVIEPDSFIIELSLNLSARLGI